MPLCLKLPPFFAKTHHHDPINFQDGVFSHFTGKDCMSFSKLHPAVFAHFNDWLSLHANNRGVWVDVYPTEELFSRVDEGGVVVVDVAGGSGVDIGRFRRKYEQGRLVLQDVPEMLGSLTALDSSIEKVPHDFFVDQPVNRAAAYFM